MTKTICFLAFDGMELLDLSGPQSAFYEAIQYQHASYNLQVVGFTDAVVRCESGIEVIPQVVIDDITHCHTLVIPGGQGSRSASISRAMLQKLSKLIALSERVVSICTGAFLLARAGLPSKTRLTTHWGFSELFKNQYPDLQLDAERIYLADGKFWSSAGVTSGIDLTLRLIELDLGKQAAHHVAKQLVVYIKRSGDQKQFSDLLDLQSPKNDKIDSVNNWIKEHLTQEITVALLSEQLHLSERQCHRFFLAQTGSTPAQYVEKLRMQIASELLSSSDKDAKAIAHAVGFNSYDGFRRAFQRNFSVSPTSYRAAFK